MLFVVAHTQPAELELALSTRHMHAPLVLLNNTFTLGARFGVQFDPRC